MIVCPLCDVAIRCHADENETALFDAHYASGACVPKVKTETSIAHAGYIGLWPICLILPFFDFKHHLFPQYLGCLGDGLIFIRGVETTNRFCLITVDISR